MLSNRPYLLRAFYQWIVDSECTPILVIDANNPLAKVPRDYVEGNEIVFNVSNGAIRDLKMTNQFVEFKASFSGVVHLISAPIKAILAIYAEENGEGIFFDAEENDEGDTGTTVLSAITGSGGTLLDEEWTTEQNQSNQSVAKGKPFLKLVE